MFSMAIAKFPATVTMPEASLPYPTILDFLERRFPRIDRQTWLKRINAGKVLDKLREPITLETGYEPLEKLYYFREVEAEVPIPFQESILYQDENFLVVDKPHFLPTTQGGRFVEQSLVHRLRERTGNDAIAPIHRIDRETAGLVMFSLNPDKRADFQLLFENRLVTKVYHAISGCVPVGDVREWHVENRLERGDPPFRIQSVSGNINARSRIELMGTNGGRSYFYLYPLTGKKHQLRHHMASIGFPVENEKYYPELQNESPDNYEKPLQLLAKELRFDDPVNGESRHFVSKRTLNW
jgi:tRNA pseudouridine32 synthase / 23S rRNA pseudouridine746 synthase